MKTDLSAWLVGSFLWIFLCFPNILNGQDTAALFQNETLQIVDSLFAIRAFDQAIEQVQLLDEKDAFWQMQRSVQILTEKRELAEAQAKLEQLIVRFPKEKRSPLQEIYLLITQGQLDFSLNYYNKNQQGKALDKYQKALDLLSDNYPKEEALKATCLEEMGKYYRFILKVDDKALDYCLASFEIRRKQTQTNPRAYFKVLYWLSSILRKKGDYSSAEIFAHETRRVAEALPKPNYFERYRSLIVSGNIYVHNLDNKKARKYFEATLPLIDQHKDLGRHSVFTSLGGIYNDLGELEKSKALFSEGLKNGTKGISRTFLSLYFRNQAVSYFANKEFEKADEFYTQGLEANQKNFGFHAQETAISFWLKGTVLDKMNKPEESHQFFHKALQARFKEFKSNSVIENPVIGNKKLNYRCIHFFKEKGIALYNLYKKDEAKINYLDAALDCFLKADSIITSIRISSVQNDTNLFLAQKEYNPVYSAALESAYLAYQKTGNKKYIDFAIMIMEKNKSISLFEAIRNANFSSDQSIPIQFRDEEASLKTKMEVNRNRINQLDEQSNLTPLEKEEINSLNREGLNLFIRMKKIKDSIKKTAPDFQETKKYYPNFSIAQRANPKEQLLEFFQKDSSVLFGISALEDEFVFERIPITDTLKKYILDYRESLTKSFLRFKNPQKSFRTFLKSAHFLYQELMEPFVMDNKTKSSYLWIVPDGIVNGIPFESFIVNPNFTSIPNYKDQPYLIQSVLVNYAFSFSTLFGQQRKTKVEKIDQVLGYSYTGENLDMPEIVGSKEELNWIKEYYDGAFFSGEKGNKECFLNQAKNKQIIHLGIHGKGGKNNKYDAALFFPAKKNKTESETLRAYELYNLKLSNPLVVLSACESAEGKNYLGEGVFSIARGFAYAGSPVLVSTFWRINDSASSAIMKSFYGYLSSGENVGTSLHLAKLDFMKKESAGTAHPSNWAAFSTLGDGFKVYQMKSTNTYYWLIIVIGAFVSLFLWRKFRLKKS